MHLFICKRTQPGSYTSFIDKRNSDAVEDSKCLALLHLQNQRVQLLDIVITHYQLLAKKTSTNSQNISDSTWKVTKIRCSKANGVV